MNKNDFYEGLNMKKYRFYFKLSTSGFQVCCEIENPPYGIQYGILDKGREMTGQKAIQYAKKYQIYHQSQYPGLYEYAIDETIINNFYRGEINGS